MNTTRKKEDKEGGGGKEEGGGGLSMRITIKELNAAIREGVGEIEGPRARFPSVEIMKQTFKKVYKTVTEVVCHYW